MKATEILNRIKAELSSIGSENVVEVKFAQMALENGTILEAAEFAPENEVFIVNEEERIPMPVGEYALEDGRILVVVEEGLIAEVKEVQGEEQPEEEAPVAEAPVAEEEMQVEEGASNPKKIVESHTIEQHFSAEDFVSKVEFSALVDELKGMIEGLRSELNAKEEAQVELSSQSAAKPIKHNPEPIAVEKVQMSSKRAKSTLDLVLEKLNK